MAESPQRAMPGDANGTRAREEQPPPAVKPLEWCLLTTLRVTSADDAARILDWYALRWRIEEYFRVLKSGCKVEELQHHTAERLERAIAIKMVVGWRIQLMVQLGRESPDLPKDLLFSDSELRVLTVFALELVRAHRPGRHPERLQRITAAYEALTDESSDKLLGDPVSSSQPLDLPDFAKPPVAEVVLSLQFGALFRLSTAHVGLRTSTTLSVRVDGSTMERSRGS